LTLYKSKTRAYLGQKFKVVLQIPDDTSDEEAVSIPKTVSTEMQHADYDRVLNFFDELYYHT
jgi:hypothetical protein